MICRYCAAESRGHARCLSCGAPAIAPPRERRRGTSRVDALITIVVMLASAWVAHWFTAHGNVDAPPQPPPMREWDDGWGPDLKPIDGDDARISVPNTWGDGLPAVDGDFVDCGTCWSIDRAPASQSGTWSLSPRPSAP